MESKFIKTKEDISEIPAGTVCEIIENLGTSLRVRYVDERTGYWMKDTIAEADADKIEETDERPDALEFQDEKEKET